jgi:PDZ domain
MRVGVVFAGSPAEQAGLRPVDRIVAIDGQKLDNLRSFYEAIIVGQKDVVELTVEEPGSLGQRQLKVVLRSRNPAPMRMSRLEHLLSLPLDYYPLGFLVVGVAVLFLRPDDPNAWPFGTAFWRFSRGRTFVRRRDSAAPERFRCRLQNCNVLVLGGSFLLLLCCVPFPLAT